MGFYFINIVNSMMLNLRIAHVILPLDKMILDYMILMNQFTFLINPLNLVSLNINQVILVVGKSMWASR
jgi:hypothetical protein